MNRNGFVTVYVLMVLQSILLAAIWWLSMVSSNVASHKPMPLHDAQIVAVYRLKARMPQIKEIAETTQDETESQIPTEHVQEEMSKQNQSESKALLFEETFYHGEIPITMYYYDTYCDLFIAHLQIRIDYDLQNQIICDYVYHSA